MNNFDALRYVDTVNFAMINELLIRQCSVEMNGALRSHNCLLFHLNVPLPKVEMNLRRTTGTSQETTVGLLTYFIWHHENDISCPCHKK